MKPSDQERIQDFINSFKIFLANLVDFNILSQLLAFDKRLTEVMKTRCPIGHDPSNIPNIDKTFKIIFIKELKKLPYEELKKYPLAFPSVPGQGTNQDTNIIGTEAQELIENFRELTDNLNFDELLELKETLCAMLLERLTPVCKFLENHLKSNEKDRDPENQGPPSFSQQLSQ